MLNSYTRLHNVVDEFILEITLNEKKKPIKISDANEYTLTQLNYSKEELLNLSLPEIMDPTVDEEILGILKKEFIESEFNCVFCTSEGLFLDISAKTLILSIDGKQLGILVGKNISEKKKAEEELSFLNEELINQKEDFEAVIDNLTQTQEQLVFSEKMAALGQLIAGIAHEINTPLGAIKASIGNLDSSLHSFLEDLPAIARGIPESDLELLNYILYNFKDRLNNLSSREKRKIRKEVISKLKEEGFENTFHMADQIMFLEAYEDTHKLIPLIRQSSDYTNIFKYAKSIISLSRNKQTISIAVEKAAKVVFALKKFSHHDSSGEKVPTDIVDSIETVLTLYYNQIKHSVEVVRQYDKIPHILCYPDEINQVWTNLIHNALQAMDHGGTLTVKVKHAEHTIDIYIEDTGVGIDPEIQDEIFKPFFTTKKSGEGSGLGLDIVKKIIEKHNASIDFESELDTGTKFIVKIPIHGEQE